MVFNRWYDHYPTLSMAISLLQNATVEHRKQTVAFMYAKLQLAHPDLLARVKEEQHTFWHFIQKRKTLDQNTWFLIESLHFVSEAECEALAADMIRYIYKLEMTERCREEEELFSAGQYFRAAM